MKRRRKRRRIKIVPVIILMLFIALLFLLFKKILNNNDEETLEVKFINNDKVYETKLLMVGDALIHDSLYNDALEKGTYNFKKYLKYIKEYANDYDIAYYNQETILGGTKIGLSTYPAFNSPQEVGDAMIDAGFNLVSLATNHTLDRGVNAVKESRKYWNKQTSVQAVGSYTSNSEKEEIESRILESNGITYAILNYTYGTNGIPVPSGKDYTVNLWNMDNDDGYKKIVKKDIEKLRDKVDVLIVAMHWGIEYTHTPTKTEEKVAKFLADNGVDIVIGTHPHVIQPTKYVGDTLVFYSLGNFISAQTSEACSNYKCNVGVMGSVKITKTVKDGESEISLSEVKNELIFTYHKNYKNFMVIPFSNPAIKDYLSDYKSVYKKYANIMKVEDNRIETVSIS